MIKSGSETHTVVLTNQVVPHAPHNLPHLPIKYETKKPTTLTKLSLTRRTHSLTPLLTMASSPRNFLYANLANPSTRHFLSRADLPPVLSVPITTLPFSKKLFCVQVRSSPPVTHAIAVTGSPSGYALAVIDDAEKAVLLVGECREGTEVVVMRAEGGAMTRFEGTTFQKLLSGGGDVPQNTPGDCATRIPQSTEWVLTPAETSTQQRIRRWITGQTRKTACPVALLNGKSRICRGLAVWELLSGSEEPQRPQRRLVRLAPAPVAGATVVKEATSEAQEKRRKAELRKARNRESAQRSNMRRKMRLQALKDELEQESLREKRLRKRERDLREENCELKMTVGR